MSNGWLFLFIKSKARYLHYETYIRANITIFQKVQNITPNIEMLVSNILSKATERSRELVVAEIIQGHY